MAVSKDPRTLETAEPFVSLFPVDPTTLELVTRSMREYGFDSTKPLLGWRDAFGEKGRTVLVDGHTRLQAAIDLKLREVPVALRQFRDVDAAVTAGIGEQVQRRNLNREQIAAYVVQLLPMLDDRTQYGLRTRTAKELAALLGVSKPTVDRARGVIASGRDDVIAAVKNGELSLLAAYTEVTSGGAYEPQLEPEPEPEPEDLSCPDCGQPLTPEEFEAAQQEFERLSAATAVVEPEPEPAAPREATQPEPEQPVEDEGLRRYLEGMSSVEVEVLGPRDGSTRRFLRAHPLAALIPMMDADEQQMVRASIAEHGVLEPILLYEGLVLDGRHRAYYASVTGRPIRVHEFAGTEDEARGMLLSLNVRNRNLNEAQRKLVKENIAEFRQLDDQSRTNTIEQADAIVKKADPLVADKPTLSAETMFFLLDDQLHQLERAKAELLRISIGLTVKAAGHKGTLTIAKIQYDPSGAVHALNSARTKTIPLLDVTEVVRVSKEGR